MIRRLTLAALFFLSSFSMAATTVFDNGAPLDLANSFSLQMVADDFLTTSASNINSVGIYAYDAGGGNRWDRTVHYAVFADDSGKIGNQLTSGLGQNLTQTAIGLVGPYGNQYLFNFDLQTAFLANPNTHYWLGVHFGTSYDYSQYNGIGWVWNYSHFRDGIGNAQRSFMGTLDNWAPDEGDRAFFLTGGAAAAVPEPESVALLLAGYALLAAKRRRKVSK